MIHAVLAAMAADPDVDGRLRALHGDAHKRAVQLGSVREGRSVFAVFAAGRTVPSAVIKVDHHARYRERLVREHAALEELRLLPAVAGSVPEPLGIVSTRSRVALAQTGLPGTPLSILMRQRRKPAQDYGEADHRRVLEWLARLHADAVPRATVLRAALVVERVEHALGAAEGAARFVRELRGMAAAFGDVALPLLPGHGDLGPTNCVVHRGAVGVYDWEGGSGYRPPLADIVVFLNHYGRGLPDASYRLPPRLDAFRYTFLADGWLASLTARSLRTQLERLGLAAEAAEYLFVATLADLAVGCAPTAHAKATIRFWQGALKAYAADRARSPLAATT